VAPELCAVVDCARVEGLGFEGRDGPRAGVVGASTQASRRPSGSVRPRFSLVLQGFFSLGVSRGDISLLCGDEGGEEFAAVVWVMGFEDSVDGVEQFACDGDEGLHLGFVARHQVLVEGLDVWIMLDGD